MPDLRPDVEVHVVTTGFDVVEKPLSAWEKFYNNGAARKIVLLVVLALLWEFYARWLNNPLLFPTFSDTDQSPFHRRSRRERFRAPRPTRS